MSIDRIFEDNFQASCDHCSCTEDYEGTFHEVVDQMKKDGWKITVQGGDYDHKCPICVADEDEEMEKPI